MPQLTHGVKDRSFASIWYFAGVKNYSFMPDPLAIPAVETEVESGKLKPLMEDG